MNRVKVKLVGGLCNYIFQIAAAYAYSLKHNKQLVLTSNDSVVIHKHVSEYTDNILNKVSIVENISNNNFVVYKEAGFHYTEIPPINSDVLLDGYFQSEKYFLEYKNEIKDLFSYPENIFNDIVLKFKEKYELNILDDSINYCSMHVRRGDYLKSPNHHPSQDVSYYMKALKKMPKDSLCLIFSDDIKWCKENFPEIPGKFIFVEGNKDYEDLLLMSLCKNNIICNSTFSWWAAWLNKNENKIVIMPKNWFGIAYSNWNTKDLICNNWTIM